MASVAQHLSLPGIGLALVLHSPPARATPEDDASPKESEKPAASGFQAAFRTGLVFPYGDATGAPGDALGDRYAWQLPFAVDLGARFARSFFAGAYLGLGFGSTGSDPRLEAACIDDDDDGQNDIVCTAVTLRAGIEGTYSFSPDRHLNPWVGYGFGWESTHASYTDHERGYGESVMIGGLTLAQLSAGFDIRRAVGVGPFLEIAIGRYTKTTTSIGEETFRTPIENHALHAWIFVGGRLVTNP